MPLVNPILKDAIDLHGGNPDNLVYPEFRILILRWDGTAFKYNNEIGGVMNLKIHKVIDPESKAFVASTAEFELQFITRPGNLSGSEVRPGLEGFGLPMSYGDIVTIWVGYNGNFHRTFNGIVQEVTASMKNRSIKVKANDIKNSLFKKDAIKDSEPYKVAITEGFDGSSEKDIADWVADVIDIINKSFASLVDVGSQAPLKIIPPNMEKTKIIINGSQLKSNVDALDVLTELMFRAGYSFDIVSLIVPDDWSQPFNIEDQINAALKLRLDINKKVFNDNVFITVEGEDMLELKFDKGFGRASVITVESTSDSGVKYTFPAQDKLPSRSNASSQGIQHKRILMPVSTSEEAKQAAISQWRILGAHQHLTVKTIGNPLLEPLGWLGIVSSFYQLDSVLVIEEVTHVYSKSGFTTQCKVVGYLYDEEGNPIGEEETSKNKITEIRSEKLQSDELDTQGVEGISNQAGFIEGNEQSDV